MQHRTCAHDTQGLTNAGHSCTVFSNTRRATSHCSFLRGRERGSGAVWTGHPRPTARKRGTAEQASSMKSCPSCTWHTRAPLCTARAHGWCSCRRSCRCRPPQWAADASQSNAGLARPRPGRWACRWSYCCCCWAPPVGCRWLQLSSACRVGGWRRRCWPHTGRRPGFAGTGELPGGSSAGCQLPCIPAWSRRRPWARVWESKRPGDSSAG